MFFHLFLFKNIPFPVLPPPPHLSEEGSKWIVDDQHLTQILHSLRSPVTPPAQRVQFILGQESQDLEHESHPVFSEMEELYVGEDGNMEWKETARLSEICFHQECIKFLLFRWVKFEEDVEEGGNRWSKPHVATLSLHSLFELRSLLLNGTVSLDMAASSLEEIADITLDNMINCGALASDKKDQVKERK